MGQQTTTIATVRFFRQDDKPPSAPDGATWVTPVDGAGNDTSSRYNYDAAAERWELDSAVGPSEPTLGTPVAGATWRDTSDGTAKQYDGASFVSLSVKDIADLAGKITEVNSQYVETLDYDLFIGAVGDGETKVFTVNITNTETKASIYVEDSFNNATLNRVTLLNSSGEVVAEKTGTDAPDNTNIEFTNLSELVTQIEIEATGSSGQEALNITSWKVGAFPVYQT